MQSSVETFDNPFMEPARPGAPNLFTLDAQSSPSGSSANLFLRHPSAALGSSPPTTPHRRLPQLDSQQVSPSRPFTPLTSTRITPQRNRTVHLDFGDDRPFDVEVLKPIKKPNASSQKRDADRKYVMDEIFRVWAETFPEDIARPNFRLSMDFATRKLAERQKRWNLPASIDLTDKKQREKFYLTVKPASMLTPLAKAFHSKTVSIVDVDAV